MANLEKILASTFQITVKTRCIIMPDGYVILLFMQQQCYQQLLIAPVTRSMWLSTVWPKETDFIISNF